MKRNFGFTIVELLIVVVVVAILTAVAVVTYSGIQARAYNDTVLADMRSNLQAFNLYFVDKGSYPHNLTQLTTETSASASPRLNVRATKSAYDMSRINFIYCFGTASDKYALVVISKGGGIYYINSSSSSPQTLSSFPQAQMSICPMVDGGNSGQWGINGNVFESWVQG